MEKKKEFTHLELLCSFLAGESTPEMEEYIRSRTDWQRAKMRRETKEFFAGMKIAMEKLSFGKNFEKKESEPEALDYQI